jgi:hypothetical protein
MWAVNTVEARSQTSEGIWNVLQMFSPGWMDQTLRSTTSSSRQTEKAKSLTLKNMEN